MITISTSGNSIIFTFENSQHYLYGNGVIETPKNSLILVTDSSEMATFKKAASNDIFISATYSELGMTKSELISYYEENMVGGGGGIDSGAVQTMIDESISGKVDTSAITSSVTSASTDSEIPTAKAVYDAIPTVSSAITSDDTNAVAGGAVYDKFDEVEQTTARALNDLNSRFSGYAETSAVTEAISESISGKVDTSAITSSVTSASTDSEIPTAKAVYDAIQGGGGGNPTVELTQAEYDALVSAGTVSADTYYIITDAPAITITSAVTSASTDSEIPTAKAVYDAVGQGGGGTTYTAGRGINITNDTISVSLPISAGTGTDSIVEGYTTTASGARSHAEGYSTTALGSYSHTEGSYTSASTVSNVDGVTTYYGYEARHAEGSTTLANNASTHTEGYYTIANNFAEHASGSYNVSNSATTTFGDSGNTLFSVGNGTADNARHNAFEIRQNGDIYITSGGTDIKLQDNLGGSVQTTSAVTSGSTACLTSGGAYEQFGGLKLQKVTQNEYDALVSGGTVDNNTLYVIS